ncbi:hypothetical protein ACVDG8_034590 [Mesorhizobium sp. ORM8.1]
MKRNALSFAMPQGRSRVGNGNALLPGIDGRSTGARRYKEILAQLTVELTREGRVSEARVMLARRAALLAIWCEDVEAQMVNGEPYNIVEFTAATNALRRVLNDAGLVWPANIRLKMNI